MNDQPDRPAQQRPKRRWLRIVLTIVLLVVAVKCVSSLIYYRSTSELIKRRLDSALRAKLEILRADGLPLTLVELDKYYPTPPPSENAATVLQEAFAICSPPVPPRSSREADLYWSRLPVIGSARLPLGTEPLPEQMKATIAEVLSQNDKALKLLHKGAIMPACRYPIDLSERFAVRLPHLNKYRLGFKLLTLEMLLHAENGQPKLAVESARAGFGMARSLANEPVLISQLLRFACQVTIASNLERVLNTVTLSDEELAQLDSALTQAENTDGLTRTFVGDRCNLLWTYDQYRKEIQRQCGFWPTLGELRQLTWRELYYFPAQRMRDYRRATSGQFELEVLMSIESYTAYIRASQLPFPDQIHVAKLIESEEMSSSSFLMTPASGGAMVKQARCVALLRAARAALTCILHEGGKAEVEGA